jgi:hypothetical protein
MKTISPLSLGTFGVQVKRFGKFKSVGQGLTFKQAMSRGTDVTSKTLARTFRITGGTGKAVTPFGFYQKKNKPLTFIEKSKYALSLPKEKYGIQSYKRRRNEKSNSLFNY